MSLAALYAARTLVGARLRSSFGHATETFGAIQRLVADAARFQCVPEALSSPQTWARLESIRELLAFVDHLERFATSAFDGSVALPSAASAVVQVAPRPSSHPRPLLTLQFFRGNRKICENWFALQLRAPALLAAVKALAPCHVVRHGRLRLRQLQRAAYQKKERGKSAAKYTIQGRSVEECAEVTELREVLRVLAQAHWWLSDVDGLRGLLAWCQRRLSPPIGTCPRIVRPLTP